MFNNYESSLDILVDFWTKHVSILCLLKFFTFFVCCFFLFFPSGLFYMEKDVLKCWVRTHIIESCLFGLLFLEDFIEKYTAVIWCTWDKKGLKNMSAKIIIFFFCKKIQSKQGFIQTSILRILSWTPPLKFYAQFMVL